MTVEARQDTLTLTDPTDIFVWDTPLQLPSDRVIWKAKGEVRGNFPGFMHIDGGIDQAQIRLTPNVLGIVGDRESFGIPSSSIHRVGLESGGEQQRTSILSVDYVDALGQNRRFWLRIEKRRALNAAFGRRGLADGLRQAGIGELRLEEVVPGFTRMRASPPLRDEQRQPPLWVSTAVVSLASGDYSADLIAWPDLFEVRYAEFSFPLPYREILGLTTLNRTPETDEQSAFLTFKDGDVLISLKLRIPDHPGNDRATASEVFSFLQTRGVRQYSAEDRLAFFDISLDESREYSPRPLFVSESSEWPRVAHGRPGHKLGATSRSSASRHSSAAPMVPSGQQRPVEQDQGEWTGVATRTHQYRALLIQVADRLLVYQSLHADDLLTEQELESRRQSVIQEIDQVHRLIQLGLMHDVNLITDEEFDSTRRELIRALSIPEESTNDA